MILLKQYILTRKIKIIQEYLSGKCKPKNEAWVIDKVSENSASIHICTDGVCQRHTVLAHRADCTQLFPPLRLMTSHYFGRAGLAAHHCMYFPSLLNISQFYGYNLFFQILVIIIKVLSCVTWFLIHVYVCADGQWRQSHCV